jgi:hypothetical protein
MVVSAMIQVFLHNKSSYVSNLIENLSRQKPDVNNQNYYVIITYYKCAANEGSKCHICHICDIWAVLASMQCSMANVNICACVPKEVKSPKKFLKGLYVSNTE